MTDVRVHTVGTGVPLALVRACGLHGMALDVDWQAHGLGRRTLPGILAVLARSEPAPLLLRTDDPLGAAVLSTLREQLRLGQLARRPVFALDLPTGTGEPTRAFRRRQLEALARWAGTVGGIVPDDAPLRHALAQERERDLLLHELDRRRHADGPAPAAGAWRRALLGALVMPLPAHLQLLQALVDAPDPNPSPAAGRVFVAGARHGGIADDERLQAQALRVVGDDLRGLTDAAAPVPAGDPWSQLPMVMGPLQDLEPDPVARAEQTVRAACARRADRIIHFAAAGDEREPWFRRWLQQACKREGLDFTAVDLPAAPAASTAPASAPQPAAAPARREPAPPPAAADDGRSRKSLRLAADFSQHQRDWFQSVRRRAHDGEPFAVIGADAPQELLRAFDLPFVVNQWWASIVAAKQHSGRYLQLLRAQGYPTDAEAYSAQGLAAVFDDAAAQAPWGGLPRPGLLMAMNGTAATAGIYRSWAAETGARLLLFDRTTEKRIDLYDDWWDRLPTDWDRSLEADRLDLLEAQFGEAVDAIQAFSGRRFDEARLREVMALVNQQEDCYRRTRDLIARAPQAPVSVADTMPAVMVPQWHRGTPWGVQAAQALHDEVRQRVEQGQAVCSGERIRLMWVGRGLWSRMAFYQQWEASHGAVFVWSMYLGLAADGYLRHLGDGQSALRALASRFVTMGDELRMPTWAGAWHVKEARLHRVDAAVAVDDADALVLAALERAGVPVLRLELDNFGAAPQALSRAEAAVGRFLDALGGQRSG